MDQKIGREKTILSAPQLPLHSASQSRRWMAKRLPRLTRGVRQCPSCIPSSSCGPSTSTRPLPFSPRRSFSVSSPASHPPPEPRFNYIPNVFESTIDPETQSYRRLTAAELSSRASPPTRVTMLVRDFIDDSLYNQNYGYFSSQAKIFTTKAAEGFEFSELRTESEFSALVARRYEELGEQQLEEEGLQMGPGTQVWHTPTELFKVSQHPQRLRDRSY